ncbi:hypothetical protein SEA_NHAGOS_80 [Gordonia phage NHagos]|nr:hypothetical protein SEA_NHAGOS_80 [Gordonia phage NHagos]
MPDTYDPNSNPPALTGNTEYEIEPAASLTADFLGRVITFDVRLDDSPVHARLTGELREVHHDLRETSVLIGSHDRDDAGSKVEWTLDHSHPIAVWEERRG